LCRGRWIPCSLGARCLPVSRRELSVLTAGLVFLSSQGRCQAEPGAEGDGMVNTAVPSLPSDAVPQDFGK